VKEIDLRNYQLDSVEGLRDGARKGHKNQLLCSPTGSGKTIIGIHLLSEVQKKGCRAVFVVERLSLIKQTSAKLDDYGLDHGVIQGNHWRTRPNEKIQVATAQTLARRGWPDFDLIIIDECHIKIKDTLDIIKPRATRTIGLTATPFADELGLYYDNVVNVTTCNKLTSEGFLVPFKIFAASEPDMRGAKVVAGEWTDAECSKRATPIIGDCVAEYMKHCAGQKFIAFGVDVAHCEEMRRQFMASGVVCELHTYKTPEEVRDKDMEEFRKPDSAIRGLISVSALSRGLDVPDVSCVVMCRPLRSSLAEFIQIIGRGLRPYPDKPFCTILDHSGNYSRFYGQMLDFFEHGAHELDKGEAKEKRKEKKEKPERKPANCPSCHHVHKPAPFCPSCGHEYPAKQTVQHKAGELFEVTGKGEKRFTTEDKRRLYSELKYIAMRESWKPKRIAAVFKDIVGTWPNAYVGEPPIEASYETRRLIQKSNAAWHIRKQAEKRIRQSWTA